MTHDNHTWRVVLDTRGPDGEPYPNIYSYVPGDTRDHAIDFVLARYVSVHGGRPTLIDGWRVVAAWAVLESAVGDAVVVEPIDQPVFRRVP